MLCRSAQGLSAGGEAAAPLPSSWSTRHPDGGLYGAWLWGTVALGWAPASVRPRCCPGCCARPIEAWGWRLAFLAALPLGLSGLYLRLRLDGRRPSGPHAGAGLVRHPVREAVAATRVGW